MGKHTEEELKYIGGVFVLLILFSLLGLVFIFFRLAGVFTTLLLIGLWGVLVIRRDVKDLKLKEHVKND